MARSYASLKKNIQIWINEAQKKLLLKAWTIVITWNLDEKVKVGAITLMSTTSLPYSLEIHITVYLGSCFQCSNKVVRVICYHELCHSLVSEFADLASMRCVSQEQVKGAEEQLVQTLAIIIAGRSK